MVDLKMEADLLTATVTKARAAYTTAAVAVDGMLEAWIKVVVEDHPVSRERDARLALQKARSSLAVAVKELQAAEHNHAVGMSQLIEDARHV